MQKYKEPLHVHSQRNVMVFKRGEEGKSFSPTDNTVIMTKPQLLNVMLNTKIQTNQN